MEDKVKIAFDASNSEQYRVNDKEGNEIVVSACIPYKQKELMAFELAEQTTVENENDCVCYQGYIYDVILSYLIVKYYTNVDVSESSYEEVYDWVCRNYLDDLFVGNIHDDVNKVIVMADRIFNAAKAIFEKNHSLSQKVLNMFGSMLDGEDMMQTIAQMPDVSNHLIEMMDAWKKQNAIDTAPQLVPLRQNGKKKSVKVGGAVLNMAKKT